MTVRETGSAHRYPDASLPAGERVLDLLAQMTLEEKAAQMICVWQRKATTLVDAAGRFDEAQARGTHQALTPVVDAVRVFDAVFDPLMGVVADRTNTRWGTFRPWVLWTAVPLGSTRFLTFTTPDFGPSGKLVYAYVTYTVFMMVSSANNLPYSAPSGVISDDRNERASLSRICSPASTSSGSRRDSALAGRSAAGCWRCTDTCRMPNRPSALQGIRLTVSVYPALTFAITLGCLFFYQTTGRWT